MKDNHHSPEAMPIAFSNRDPTTPDGRENLRQVNSIVAGVEQDNPRSAEGGLVFRMLFLSQGKGGVLYMSEAEAS
jgi:hypothetical protein